MFLTITEAAEMLHAHPETVRKLAAGRKLPATKIGKAWIFDREQLIAGADQPDPVLTEAERLIRRAYGAVGTLRRMAAGEREAYASYGEWQREADAWLSTRTAPQPSVMPADEAWCGECGALLEAVRPGKWQHIGECTANPTEDAR